MTGLARYKNNIYVRLYEHALDAVFCLRHPSLVVPAAYPNVGLGISRSDCPRAQSRPRYQVGTGYVPGVQQLRLGHEGELAVGQELNKLMSVDYRVYYDLLGDGFNVNHVLIGQTGAFVVETKARRKLVTGDGRADVKVDYTGQVLRFPSWTDRETLDQTQR